MLNEIIWTMQFIGLGILLLILLLPIYGLALPIVIDLMNNSDN